MSARWQKLALPLTLLAGFILRCINLNSRPIWYDEAFAVLYAEKSPATMIYGTVTQVEGAAADVHPLFYYFSLHYWMNIFGQAPWAVRLPSVILGTLTIWLAFLIGRRLWEHKVGLVAAIIVAISPFQIAYAQEARMYALLGFAASAVVFTFIRAWQTGHWGWWLAVGLSGTVTLYAHNLGFLTILALDVWVLWAWFRARGLSYIGPLVASHLLMLLLFSPWLMLVPSQLGKIEQSYWVQQPGAVELVQTILTFHTNLPLPGWSIPFAFFMASLIAVLVGLETIRLLRRPAAGEAHLSAAPDIPAAGNSYAPGILLLLSGSLLPIVVLFLVSQIRPVYVIRALLPAALFYNQLIALVLIRSRMPRLMKQGLSVIVLLVLLFSLGYHYTFATFPRPPFAQAAAFLRQEARPEQAIVHSNKLTYFPMYYYQPTLSQSFIADPAGDGSDTLAYPTQEALGLFATPTLEEAVAGHSVVWFVIFEKAIVEFREAGLGDHPHKRWLDAHYKAVKTIPFNDLELHLYEAP